MNPGRGWNPNLEESYLPEYSDSEAEIFTQCTTRISLWPVKILASKASAISHYSESARITKLSLLGFSSMKP